LTGTVLPLRFGFRFVGTLLPEKTGSRRLSLKRTLEIGSYQTVWAILHRLRSVLIRPDRERLCGKVEVDETYIGGKESGLSGGRAKGKKILTCIAIEILEPKGFGRCRMAPVADASSESLYSFVLGNVEPGATVITDEGYQGLEKNGYIHDRRSQRAASARGEDPGELLPGAHRIASLAKRWLLGTHQGAVDSAHLPSYLDEFVFRFNRRHSRSRGMLFYRVLELAVAHGPVRYQDLVMSQSPKVVPPKPPRQRGHPPSLARPSPSRPWRQNPNSG
jgi:transposase-like protein